MDKGKTHKAGMGPHGKKMKTEHQADYSKGGGPVYAGGMKKQVFSPGKQDKATEGPDLSGGGWVSGQPSKVDYRKKF